MKDSKKIVKVPHLVEWAEIQLIELMKKNDVNLIS